MVANNECPVRHVAYLYIWLTHTHTEATEPLAFRWNGLHLSGFWKILRLQCRVCESSMLHLIPNTAEMPKCFSGDVHTWSQDSRGRTLCSHCNSSSLRLKERGSNTPGLLLTILTLHESQGFWIKNFTFSFHYLDIYVLHISNTTVTERYFRIWQFTFSI